MVYVCLTGAKDTAPAKQSVSELLEDLQRRRRMALAVRRPLQRLTPQVKQIKQFNPRFEEKYGLLRSASVASFLRLIALLAVLLGRSHYSGCL